MIFLAAILICAALIVAIRITFAQSDGRWACEHGARLPEVCNVCRSGGMRPPSYPPAGDRLFGLPILPHRWRPTWWQRGVTRECFLIGTWAVKLPSLYDWRNFLQGVLANMQEREMATLRTPELCPILFSTPGGWLVVMRRARALSDAEWTRFRAQFGPDRHPRDPVKPWINPAQDYFVPVEMKRDSFGILDGMIVAVDYGN